MLSRYSFFLSRKRVISVVHLTYVLKMSTQTLIKVVILEIDNLIIRPNTNSLKIKARRKNKEVWLQCLCERVESQATKKHFYAVQKIEYDE